MKQTLLLKGLIGALVVFAALGSVGVVTKLVVETNQAKVTKAVAPTPTPVSSYFKYEGKEGIDALTLLKYQAYVHESQPGFVDEINGRKADKSKHEYWAFYVNGKASPVGAAQYMTHDNDTIEWKIETY